MTYAAWRAGAMGLLLSFVSFFPACSYVVDVVRYATEEHYVHGHDALIRLQTAALIGYTVRYNQSPSSADARAPIIALLSARVKEDRDYLETSVAACETNLLLSNAAGADLVSQLLSGVFCDMGPGKSPSQL